jgi:hypothetical protein
LVLATGLVTAVVAGGLIAFFAVEPSVPAEQPGGHLTIEAGHRCGTVMGNFSSTCFEWAHATIHYASGAIEEVSLQATFDKFRGSLFMQEARASIHIATDKGTWVRDVWVPQDGGGRTVSINPTNPKVESASSHLPPLPILAMLGVMALAGVGLMASAVGWMTGSITAAVLTRLQLSFHLVVQAAGMLFALLQSSLGLAAFAGLAWLYFLRHRTASWIRDADAAS